MNILLQFLLLLFLNCALYGQIRINEFQAVNTSTYADMVDFADYADWIELYNASDASIDLSNYYLTDNLRKPLKWPFPAGSTIAGNDYLIVWADQADAGIGERHRRPYWPWAEFRTKSLHANFKLSSAGEELGLFRLENADTVAVDTLRFGRQAADVSRGRLVDGNGEWAWFGDPTPGLSNSTQTSEALHYAAEPLFLQASSFLDAVQTLEIAAPSPSAEIYYSTDGSKPSKYAPASLLYRDPIRLEKNAVLKARAYEAEKLPSPVKTQTYFVGEAPSALPTLSYAVDPRVFSDVEKGIYRNSFKQREVPVHIEFFQRDRTPAFSLDAGSRIGGLNIWRFAQKPLTIYLRDRYGADALHYPLFADEGVGIFARFSLRNGGDDWPSTLLRDPFAERIAQGQMANEGLAYRPVSAFVNGEYWGIYNLRERFDTQFFLAHFKVSPSQYTHLEFVAVEADSTIVANIAEDSFELAAANGRLDEYLDFESALGSMNGALEQAFALAQETIDLASYIDFLSIETYAVNTSWFHNRELWKAKGEDGKWQWLLTDLDKGFLLENVESSLLDDFRRDPIYAQLIKNAAFRQLFIQRYTAHLNNTFSAQRLKSIADSLALAIAPEIPRHSAKWSFQGGIASEAAWRQSLLALETFLTERSEHSFAEIGDFFGLGERFELRVEKNMDDAGDLYINGIQALSDDGTYFAAVAIELTAIPRPGYRFVGWDADSTTEKLIVHLQGDSTVKALFKKSSDSEIPAEIVGDFTLKKESSPYYAVGDISVRAGAKLQVEAGVEIRMPRHKSIYVAGLLHIAGSENEPVRIVANEKAGAEKWGALCFVESRDTSIVRHLYMRNASQGADPLHQLAAISAQNSHLVLDHLDIDDVDFPIFVRGGSVVLQNSRLHADASSDYINVKRGAARSENNVFVGNDAPDTDAIDYDGVVDGVIRNNTFYNFTGANSDAIDIGEEAQNVLIADNRIFNMSDKGVSVGQRSTVRMEGNLIFECAMGVAVKDSSYAFIHKNTFYGNALAVACFEKNIGEWGGRAEVVHSILASSSLHSTLVDEYSELQVRYSLSNTDTLVGAGNLFLDAGFKDARTYNVELRDDSPAVDAGDPSYERDRDGSPIDLGAGVSFAADLWPEEIAQALVPSVLISEIMYRANENFDGGDWVELYNTTETTHSLAGWSFTDSDSTHRFELPLHAAIEPRGYLVVARNIELFQVVYPAVENVVGSLEFGLAPQDHVRLYDAEGLLISDTAYSNEFPWPRAADGLGGSLALNTQFPFNRHVDNWVGSALKGSPGRMNPRSSKEGDLVANESLIRLDGNVPNPFNRETTIRYFTAQVGAVKIEIYNIAGQRLVTFRPEKETAGAGEFVWDGLGRNGSRVAAGIYLYTLSSKGETKSARMLVLR
ncbi:MAG: hypothetical protein ACI8PG_005043 [Planctomycetota bacterium]